MEKLLGYTSKFIKVAFKPNHKFSKEVRHLTDIESNIKHCLDDLLENSYLNKEDCNFVKPRGSKAEVLYGLCKVKENLMNLMDYLHLAQFFQP